MPGKGEQVKKQSRIIAGFCGYLSILVLLTGCEADFELWGLLYSKTRVKERFDFSIATNETLGPRNIITSSDTYSLFFASDIHMGGTQNLSKLIDSAKGHQAKAMILVGDLTTGKAEDYDVFRQHLPDTGQLTTFLAIGNHDLYFDGWQRFKDYFGSSVYTFTVQTPVATDLFICLDSGGGTHGPDQLQWLRKILQEQRTLFRRCIVFTHNNFFRAHHTPSTNPQVDEIAVLIDLFLRHSVDLVVTGHDHKRSVEVFGNTHYVTLDALKDTNANAGYLVAEVDNGTIQYNFVSW